MGEYRSGLTISQAAEFDKERVRHALNGELMCGESERGFEYEPAPKDECDAYVLSVVDNWYYQAKQLADSGRAMERVMEANGFSMKNHFREYMDAMAEASREFATFVYEHEIEELHEEADGILGGDNGLPAD